MMGTSVQYPWQVLLPPPEAGQPGIRLDGWLVRKHGEALLWLPAQPALARHTLRLYPAQTRRARWARQMLDWALRLGRPLGLAQASFMVRADAPFLEALRTGLTPGAPLRFGIFCGNPRSPGRRFLFLRYTASGRPDLVFKAGTGAAARVRWAGEVQMLRSVPAELLHTPALLGLWEQDSFFAMIQAYVEGQTPRRSEAAPLASLLTEWIDTQRCVPLNALTAWNRMRELAAARSFPSAWLRRLESVSVHPVLFHGDLAPWNIRVQRKSGRWWVLDWERGQRDGPPGWDWAYYLVQEAMLVRGWRTTQLLQMLETWWSCPFARSYFRQAGADAIRQSLVAAGLLYHFLEWPPDEGSARWESLLGVLLTHPAVSGS
ncbi:MAG: phosphotransferase [Verrucomicrobiota bacterium]|nr:phosphotransferase [Limisphaera sp.]MDW8380878.1 phosphotransferase [Verrucomicrobiota bacterium]